MMKFLLPLALLTSFSVSANSESIWEQTRDVNKKICERYKKERVQACAKDAEGNVISQTSCMLNHLFEKVYCTASELK